MSALIQEDFSLENGHPGDVALRLTVETLDTPESNIRSVLYRYSTGEATETSQEAVSLLDNELFLRAYGKVFSILSKKRYEDSLPSRFSKELIMGRAEEHLDISSQDRVGYNDIVLLLKDKEKTETEREYFFPYLLWAPKDKTNNKLLKTKSANGWKLSLSGFENLTLGFAEWNDLDGIKRLISMMSDEENLAAMAALLDPKQSENLLSVNKINKFLLEKAAINFPRRRNKNLDDYLIGFPEYFGSGNSDSKRRDPIPERIFYALAASYKFDEYAYINTVRLSIDGTGIMYAFETPNFRLKISPRYLTYKKRSEKFPKLLESLGLRVTEAPLVERMAQDNKKYTWATPFSVEDWQALLKLNVERIWEFETVSFRKPRYNSY